MHRFCERAWPYSSLDISILHSSLEESHELVIRRCQSHVSAIAGPAAWRLVNEFAAENFRGRSSCEDRENSTSHFQIWKIEFHMQQVLGSQKFPWISLAAAGLSPTCFCSARNRHVHGPYPNFRATSAVARSQTFYSPNGHDMIRKFNLYLLKKIWYQWTKCSY